MEIIINEHAHKHTSVKILLRFFEVVIENSVFEKHTSC